MRRIVVLLLVVLVVAGCSSGGSTPAPKSTPNVQAVIRPLMRQDVDQLATKDDATLDRVAVQQCADLAASGYLVVLKGDLLSGVPARQAGALIAYAVQGWCPDELSKLPQT